MPNPPPAPVSDAAATSHHYKASREDVKRWISASLLFLTDGDGGSALDARVYAIGSALLEAWDALEDMQYFSDMKCGHKCGWCGETESRDLSEHESSCAVLRVLQQARGILP